MLKGMQVLLVGRMEMDPKASMEDDAGPTAREPGLYKSAIEAYTRGR